MTDDEIRAAIRQLREVAAKVGPLHGYWDIITDAEQLLAGKRTILSRKELVEVLRKRVAA